MQVGSRRGIGGFSGNKQASFKIVGIAPKSTTTVKGNTYTANTGSTLTLKAAANKKSVSIPAKLVIQGKSYIVTGIEKNAFTGSSIRTVTIGANVKKIAASAFSGSRADKIKVYSKNLKAARAVKGCSKGSLAKKITVYWGKVGKQYVKASFTKKNTKAKKAVFKK